MYMNKVSVFLFLILVSCVQKSEKIDLDQSSLIEKENALLKKEIELKNKELQQKNRELDLANEQDVPISELYKQVKKGVFLIYTQDQGSISQGTGFFLNNMGVGISNFHVFGKADRSVVFLDNGKEYMINRIIEYNEELDYVIFQVDSSSNDFFPLDIASETSEIGAMCFAIGNPKGLTQTLSTGIVSGFREGNKFIQNTVEITHGSSGGPLFNKNGKVIGITSGGVGEANLNFALNISRVPYQKYTSVANNEIYENESIPLSSIKTTINNYYWFLQNDDFNALKNFYAPILDRYYRMFNISNKTAINEAINYKNRYKIISAVSEIHWSTLKVRYLQDGNYFVSFNMDYFLRRYESNKSRNFNIDIVMIITKDMKITCCAFRK